MTKKIMECPDPTKRKEYELLADGLNRKMKIKAKNINRLKSYLQNKVQDLFSFHS